MKKLIDKCTRLWRETLRFFRWWSVKNLASFCAETSFFLFLSLVPLMMLAVSLILLTPLRQADVVDFLLRVAPETERSFISDLVETAFVSSGSGTVTFSALLALWSASAAAMAMRKALNVIYHMEENRSYFIRRGICILYTVLFLIGLALILIANLYFNLISQAVNRKLFTPTAAERLGEVLRYPISGLIFLLIFQSLYTVLPAKPLRFTRQFPGALFSALVLLAATFVFNYWTGRQSAYSIYGNLRSVIILMIGIHGMTYIVLLGAGLNRRLALRRKGLGLDLDLAD